MRPARRVPHAQEVGALVHRQGQQAANLLDQGSFTFLLERVELSLFSLLGFLAQVRVFQVASNRVRECSRQICIVHHSNKIGWNNASSSAIVQGIDRQILCQRNHLQDRHNRLPILRIRPEYARRASC